MTKGVLRRSFLCTLAVLLLALSIWAQAPANTAFMPLEEVHAGMKGVAYTVFEGVKPEPMDLTVLGVLKNVNGPKGDLILVRLEGKKPEFTGVVAGMSGSPVYIDGKLVGALAFRVGQFSREPIAGVTPIYQMLEINEMDGSPAGETETAAPKPETTKVSSAGAAGPIHGLANYLTPIEAPFVFNGFSEAALKQFAPQFAAAGIVPVIGTGSVTGDRQPEPIEPGSAVSAVLVRGDMDISATCTVTYLDAKRLLACGHPLMQFGQVDMPMYKAQVVATLASPLNAFKIVNTTESVGAFVQDRHTGILGRFGREADMIPVTLTVHGPSKNKEFHFQVLNNPKLTPAAMMSTVFSALQGVNEYGEDVTYRMQGGIQVNGYPDVALQNMFAPADGGIPTGVMVAMSLGERFSRIYDNPYDKPRVEGVRLDVELLRERRAARLESARTDVTEARPGDDIVIEAVLRPYRGDRIVANIPVRIPTSTPRGILRILVSDGESLDRARRFGMNLNRKLDLASTIALLNKEHVNTGIYVSLLEANPEAMVGDKVMPALPLSVMNVMDGMRGTQDMVVLGESSVNEASAPTDYVVSGAQVITVSIK